MDEAVSVPHTRDRRVAVLFYRPNGRCWASRKIVKPKTGSKTDRGRAQVAGSLIDILAGAAKDIEFLAASFSFPPFFGKACGSAGRRGTDIRETGGKRGRRQDARSRIPVGGRRGGFPRHLPGCRGIPGWRKGRKALDKTDGKLYNVE